MSVNSEFLWHAHLSVESFPIPKFFLKKPGDPDVHSAAIMKKRGHVPQI